MIQKTESVVSITASRRRYFAPSDVKSYSLFNNVLFLKCRN